jgi:hypothetical protein
VRLFFHKVSFIINTSFLPLLKKMCVRRLNLSSETSELFTHAVFHLVVFSKMASSGCKLLGTKKMGRQRVLNLDCREDEEESFTARPLQLCPLCTDWCAVWIFPECGLDSSSCLPEPYIFVVVNVAVVPNQRIKTIFGRFRHCRGWSPISLSPFLQRRTHRPTKPASMASAPRTLLRLRISI